MTPKVAKRWLKKNEWNLSPTKLETYSDQKRDKILKMETECKKVLRGE